MRLLYKLKYNIRLFFIQNKWRRRNKHNRTNLLRICNMDKIFVGRKTYGSLDILDCSSNASKLIIGSYCSIADGTKFLLGAEHSLYTISTYPFKTLCFKKKNEASSKGDITLKNCITKHLESITAKIIEIGGNVDANGDHLRVWCKGRTNKVPIILPKKGIEARIIL